MLIIAFIAGVALGGVLNLVIYRLPRLQPLPDVAAGTKVEADAASHPAAPSSSAELAASPAPLSTEPTPPEANPHPELAASPAPLSTEPTLPEANPHPELATSPAPLVPTSPAFPEANSDMSTVPPVVAALLPADGKLHCTRSGELLGWADSVPLLGWVSQGGRCRHCHQWLPISFPLVELCTGLAFVAAYIDYDLAARFYLYAAYSLVLIIVMVIDWQHHEIYSVTLLAGAAVAMLGWLLNPEVNIGSSLVGAAVGGGVLLLLYFLAKLLYGGEEEPLAFGDVQLAVMMGLMLGYPTILGALLLGPLVAGITGLGLVLARRKSMHDYIPIGASFCFATIAALLLRDQLWHALPVDNLAYWLGTVTDNIRDWFASLIQ